MLTRDNAYALAEAYVKQQLQPAIAEELAISGFGLHPPCWVAIYNTRKYVETGRSRFALAGNGPLFIDCETGTIRQGVSGRPVEDQLDE